VARFQQSLAPRLRSCHQQSLCCCAAYDETRIHIAIIIGINWRSYPGRSASSSVLPLKLRDGFIVSLWLLVNELTYRWHANGDTALRALGTALEWPDAKKQADLVREWGIKVSRSIPPTQPLGPEQAGTDSGRL
jgi:hypothetical protein